MQHPSYYAEGRAEGQGHAPAYNWASAPPYGEVAAPGNAPYYHPPGDYPAADLANSNYGYNPAPAPAPAPAYPNSFSQYQLSTPSATATAAAPPPPPQFASQPQSSNYGYTNPSALFYTSPSLPNPIPNPSPSPNPNGLSYAQPPESRGYPFEYPQGFYDTTPPSNNSFEVDDGGFGGEVYAYDGGRMEPYGARGTGSSLETYGARGTGSSNEPYGARGTGSSMAFDDYGNLTKITKAIPKTEAHDEGNGVQKFRVKILPDSSSASGSASHASMDVLCQIGLDGLRMLDPNTFKTLRIYPLDTITRWEVTDPSVYTFWAKSSVDIEPRRIRLQSNRYTTSTILDTVAAACVQIREMAEDKSNSHTDTNISSEQLMERKKASIADWMILKKPAEEKQHWVPDEAVTKCTACGTDFGAFCRRHHCRNCGDIFCDKCTQGRVALTADKDAQPVRVCDRCLAEVTQRLAGTKEKSHKDTTQRTHDDLAKRLLEEMGRNRKANTESGGSSGPSSIWSSHTNSEGSTKRTKEVACPTCTVHLQVRVPSSGTETVECGVCQHPFLVSAR